MLYIFKIFLTIKFNLCLSINFNLYLDVILKIIFYSETTFYVIKIFLLKDWNYSL